MSFQAQDKIQVNIPANFNLFTSMNEIMLFEKSRLLVPLYLSCHMVVH
jgi:hypothetical protein